MQRLSQVNAQFAPAKKGGASGPKVKPKKIPVADVWMSMGLDQHLSARAVTMRKATEKMMESISKDLMPYIESTEFPSWLVDKIKHLGVNGLQIKGFGSPGLSTLEAGAVIF